VKKEKKNQLFNFTSLPLRYDNQILGFVPICILSQQPALLNTEKRTFFEIFKKWSPYILLLLPLAQFMYLEASLTNPILDLETFCFLFDDPNFSNLPN